MLKSFHTLSAERRFPFTEAWWIFKHGLSPIEGEQVSDSVLVIPTRTVEVSKKILIVGL